MAADCSRGWGLAALAAKPACAGSHNIQSAQADFAARQRPQPRLQSAAQPPLPQAVLPMRRVAS